MRRCALRRCQYFHLDADVRRSDTNLLLRGDQLAAFSLGLERSRLHLQASSFEGENLQADTKRESRKDSVF